MAFPTLSSLATWIRDAEETTYEQRVTDAEAGSGERRRVSMLVLHKDVAMESTFTVGAYNLKTSATMADPVVDTSMQIPGGSIDTYTYSGAWDVEKISFDDQGNGCTRITATLRRTGDWEAWTPAEWP